MSIVGAIGFFFRQAAEGVAEILSAPFQDKRPDHVRDSNESERDAGGARGSAFPHPGHAEAHVTEALALPGVASDADAPTQAAIEAMSEAKGRIVSNEPYGPEYPASLVTRRYRALKAEGLTPKQASEFSHSAKKYARYKTLSTTRPYEGAETYWEMLQDFDQKTAAHIQSLKQNSVLKQDLVVFKEESELARNLLIQTFLDGATAIAEHNLPLVKKIAEAINFEHVLDDMKSRR